MIDLGALPIAAFCCWLIVSPDTYLRVYKWLAERQGYTSRPLPRPIVIRLPNGNILQFTANDGDVVAEANGRTVHLRGVATSRSDPRQGLCFIRRSSILVQTNERDGEYAVEAGNVQDYLRLDVITIGGQNLLRAARIIRTSPKEIRHTRLLLEAVGDCPPPHVNHTGDIHDGIVGEYLRVDATRQECHSKAECEQRFGH